MSRVFISYVAEDAEVALELADALEAPGYETWYYDRDSYPGPSYLAQVGAAIDDSDVVLILISTNSVLSEQITKEVVRGHESGKPFVPVLLDLTHVEFQQRRPEWRTALGAAASVRLTSAGVSGVAPRIIKGLSMLGLHIGSTAPVAQPGSARKPEPAAKPASAPTARQVPPPVQPNPQPAPPAAPAQPGELWQRVGNLEVRLEAKFDADSYSTSEPMARVLVEAEVRRPPRGPQVQLPVDLTLVLDVSGSMQKEQRYELLEEAVAEFFRCMTPTDRLSIVLFSSDAHSIVERYTGAQAVEETAKLLKRMRDSHVKFGPKTNVAPALEIVNAQIAAAAKQVQAVNRVYVLTDGRWHDPLETREQLKLLRNQKAEVGVYGFGTEFDPKTIKMLLTGLLGGWVKPIVNQPEIVATFGHVAKVNQSVVARDARLTIEFSEVVSCGDAWAFRPQERYFGQMAKRRSVCPVGALEAGRQYSWMFEARLPERRGVTQVATARLKWLEGEQSGERTIAFSARQEDSLRAPSASARQVQQIYDVLNGLRCEADEDAQLRALKAQVEIAKAEGRNPKLIERLEQEIVSLEASDEDIVLGFDDPAQELLKEADQVSHLVYSHDDTSFSLELEGGEDSGIRLLPREDADDDGTEINLDDLEMEDASEFELTLDGAEADDGAEFELTLDESPSHVESNNDSSDPFFLLDDGPDSDHDKNRDIFSLSDEDLPPSDDESPV